MSAWGQKRRVGPVRNNSDRPTMADILADVGLRPLVPRPAVSNCSNLVIEAVLRLAHGSQILYGAHVGKPFSLSDSCS
jgi:hypothetical protein